MNNHLEKVIEEIPFKDRTFGDMRAIADFYGWKKNKREIRDLIAKASVALANDCYGNGTASLKEDMAQLLVYIEQAIYSLDIDELDLASEIYMTVESKWVLVKQAQQAKEVEEEDV